MRLHKQLAVAGKPVPLIDEDVRLDLFSPGRAAFTVRSTEMLNGLVQLDLGYKLERLQRFFLGYVVSCTRVDAERQKVFCRELTGALVGRLPLSLRYVTLAEVLARIEELTGLAFVTGRGPYTQLKAPACYSAGGGYWVMDSLAQVFSIPQCIWQQQGNGQVYVGSWAESFWAGRALELPSSWQKDFGVARRARIPCIPPLRPGVRLNGSYVTKVALAGNFMNLTWSADPWKKPSAA